MISCFEEFNTNTCTVTGLNSVVRIRSHKYISISQRHPFIQPGWSTFASSNADSGMNERGGPGGEESCVQVDINANRPGMATRYSS